MTEVVWYDRIHMVNPVTQRSTVCNTVRFTCDSDTNLQIVEDEVMQTLIQITMFALAFVVTDKILKSRGKKK